MGAFHRGKRTGFPGGPGGFFPRAPSLGGFFGSDTGAAGRGNPTPSTLTVSSETAGGASVNTASISPGANRLVIAVIAHATAAAPGAVTAAGNSLTWVEVNSVNYTANNRRLTIFRAMGASPTSGAVTFTFAGPASTSSCWQIFEFTGVDTSGTDGSGAVVQNPAVATVGAGVGSMAAPTLSAFEHANNVNFTVVANDINGTMTHDASFTELADDNEASGNITLETQWAINVLANTTTFSGTTSAGAGAHSIEIKAS